MGFGKILVEVPRSLGRAVGEDPSAQGQQHLSTGQDHTHQYCLHQQSRGKELPQPPNWAFWPCTHCGLPPGTGSQVVVGPTACIGHPGDPQLDPRIGSTSEKQPCATGSCCRTSARPPVSRHRAREGPFGDGWGSCVKEKRVWGDMSMGQGWAEPQHCVTELVLVKSYLADEDKGTVDNKNDSKSTENYCKYLLR